MARILSVDPERARGLRTALVWMAKRQYRGVVPGIFKILAQDLNVGLPASWLYNHLHMRKGSLATVINGLVGGAP